MLHNSGLHKIRAENKQKLMLERGLVKEDLGRYHKRMTTFKRKAKDRVCELKREWKLNKEKYIIKVCPYCKTKIDSVLSPYTKNNQCKCGQFWVGRKSANDIRY